MARYIAAAVQMDSQTDIEANLEMASSLLRQAVSMGAKLVVFPECMNYCGPDTDVNAEEIRNGKTFSMLQEAAKQFGVWIHCGSIHEKNKDGGKPYNTSFVVSPDGELKAVYRKLHLFDLTLEGGKSFQESSHVEHGDAFVTLDSNDLGTLGLSICYDLRFPEQFRMETLLGADVLCNPACFNGTTGLAHWDVLLRARAIENGCYVIAPDQTGQKVSMNSYGHSMIVDPWGRVLACLEDGPGVITAEIDTDYAGKLRRQTGTILNRRTDLYSLELLNRG